MTLGSSIRQFVENIARSLAITSASPQHTNRVKALDYFGEAGDFEDILRQDVIKIIEDEIKIQMKEFREDPSAQPTTPIGSVEAQFASQVKKGISVAQSPASAASDVIKYLPHAALVTLAISLTPIVIGELSKPGGFMDVRWKRRLEEEQNAFMDRQTQRNTQMGIRKIQIQSRAGFISINGANNSNNLREIREGGVNKDRLAQIDIKDHTMGLFK